MLRSGVEPKPAWQTIPRSVRAETESLLGARVARATRAWGGYSPTPTYRLRLADGRRAFFKAVGPSDNEFARLAHSRELRVYRELAGPIGPWAPAFLGTIEVGPWSAMLLEDLGPKCAPPWTDGLARRVTRSLASFHRSTLGATLPDWLPRPERHLLTDARMWRLAVDPTWLRNVAALAGALAGDALRWLEAHAPALAEWATILRGLDEPMALVHRDVRSDNLRWVDGRVRLLDWPHVGVGPVEDDAVIFVQSVKAEGGPDPESLIAAYAEVMPVRPDVLGGAVSSVAAFFADQAWRPEIPGLPRLRAFQRRQLQVSLAWASRLLGLPEPTWLGAIGRDRSQPGI